MRDSGGREKNQMRPLLHMLLRQNAALFMRFRNHVSPAVWDNDVQMRITSRSYMRDALDKGIASKSRLRAYEQGIGETLGHGIKSAIGEKVAFIEDEHAR